VEVVLFGNVSLDHAAHCLVEVGEDLQQLFVLFVDALYEVGHLVPFSVGLRGSLEAALEELRDVDGVVVLVRPADGQAFRADHALGLAFVIDAHESGGLLVNVTVVRLDKLLECSGEGINL
jgi:hypothetical protein